MPRKAGEFRDSKIRLRDRAEQPLQAAGRLTSKGEQRRVLPGA